MKTQVDHNGDCHSTLKEAFRNLIRSNLISQRIFLAAWQTPNAITSDLAYAKEFATIRIASSRRAGHTLAIIDMIHEFFNHAVILSNTRRQQEYLMEQIRFEVFKPSINGESYMGGPEVERTPSLFRTANTTIHLGTINSLDSFRGLDRSLEAVFIDCASFVSDKKMDKVYKTFLPYIHSPIKDHIFQYIFVQ